MKNISSLLIIASIFTYKASAQKIIKAKDAQQYIGKIVTVMGNIKYIAGPGYLSSTSFQLVNDNSEVGVVITVPMKIWSKSKVLNEKQTGKIMEAHGLIEQIIAKDKGQNSLPYIVIKSVSDVQIRK